MAPGFHHVEVWIADLDAVRAEWAWLLTQVGWTPTAEWPDGQSWSAGSAYLTLTTSPNMSNAGHDRRRPGVNHLAFRGGSASVVDALVRSAPDNGWLPLYAERYPHAGGVDHYAGWLENSSGFKVEVVADGGVSRV
ncbi:VOC family protein [Pseudoclavibacter sp. VKM Ac-2888]|uniref:VOC family protein n=1 Tax=Pseudoclavibacter sp. VKM Ac-2888 TaxID=2783830 RepID=UPI00188C711B|nr:VOC family protein [Pseudoclavibacter sp. VKM Ac-2888]MBF4551898.1 VOC family protein [Pseudoclavibacter sp. VKM Ac-2888]